MKPKHSILHPSGALGAAALLALPMASLDAQVTSTTPGEIAVYSNFGAFPVALPSSTAVDNEFLFDELGGVNLAAPVTDLELSQGKYLVLYSCRVDNVGGTNRSNFLGRLTLEPAGGGGAVALPYGTSQGFIRDSGNNPLVAILSGGTIVEAANTGDILRLQTDRTDVNTNASVDLVADGTSIQFLKLDDGWPYLRLTQSADSLAPTSTAYADVVYDVVDENTGGVMNFTSGSGAITFTAPGHYLVLANTQLRRRTDNNNRIGFTQQLTLDGTLVEGSRTTTYIRGTANGPETCLDGGTAIGTIIEAAAGQTLNVELSEEFANANAGDTDMIAAGTALAIVQLPAFGQYISLSDTSGQNINNATPVPMNFATQIGTPGSDFTHVAGTSAVTVNTADDYLFLGGFFCDDDTANRQVPYQQWSVNAATLFYGQSSRYSRNTDVHNNGNWSGALARLTGGDQVEMTMAKLASDSTAMPGNSLGLQGVRIGSLFPSGDPLLAVNNPLSIVQGTSGTITTSLLQTVDADTGPAGLTYTVDSLPAPADGTLLLNGVPLAVSGTFTQAHVDNNLVTYDATANLGSFGIDLTVSDGGASDAGTFTVNVGATTVATPDTGATDEETAITMLDGGATSVLDNDTGTGLTVSGFDAVSALGAAVNVNPDGTFTYDPSGSATLQALAINEQVVDTFNYTLLDFANTATPVMVSITVDGVNDASVVAGETASSTNGAGASASLLDNDSDTDASDVLTVSNLQDVFSNGGAVPTATFNFQFVPLVFTSNAGATVSISADGIFSYDPGTSTTILNLPPGVEFTETFTYDVFDGTATVQATVVVTSTGVASPTNDYATTPANATVNIAVLSNDQVRKPGGALGTPTPGFNLEFHADTPGNSSTQWFNTGSASVASIPSNGVIDATFNPAPTNSPPGITATYDFAGVEGIVHLDFEQATYGDIDAVSSTLEMLIRPRDQVGSEVLWEVGGLTDGSSFAINGDMVAWSSVDNGNLIAQAVGQLPPAAVAGGDFVHLVAQIDLNNDIASLFINGQLVGTGAGINVDTGAPGNLADWCGTDDGGLGRVQSDVGGADPNLGNFGTFNLGTLTDYDGEISLARTYPSLLTPTQITANFDSIFGSPVAAVSADIINLAGTDSPSVGAAIALQSGATVTLQADGSITYDPNTAFDNVGVGLSKQDSFTYTLDGSTASVVTVNVDVDGTNTDPQITIAAVNSATLEGLGTTFTISSSAPVSGAVDVSLSFDGLADLGPDFTGITTVQIANSGSSATLFTFVLADPLFEGAENIIVEIDAVTGNAVLGATLAAETIINDAQTAPEFSIAADQASAAEGTAAGFTITPTVVSQADRTLALSYSGTAVNGADFFGETTLVIPGGSATGALSVFLSDDAAVEGTEDFTVTLDSVDIGTIGAGNSASTDITDGTAECLFLADFENIDPFDTPGGTVFGTDTPAAANLGTPVGSWENIITATAGGDTPGIYFESDDQKGDGIDSALVQDRPGAGEGSDITARLEAPADLSGGNTAVIGMDLGNRRTVGGTEIKSWRIIGLDDSGQKSFELYVSGNDSAPNNERLLHVDELGNLTPLGSAFDFDNTGSTEGESRQTRLVLALTSGGYQVAIDRTPMDGIFETVTGVLAYAGPATQVSGIVFQLNGSADINESTGVTFDDMKVSGTRGNIAPSATDGGNPLANGGSTVLSDAFIGTGTLLDTLQVADADAGSANVTATFDNAGTAPLTFTATASGSASLGGNGSGTLTITGSLTDVNGTLASGVTYTTDAVTGGDAAIQFTINDNGNTGPGGAKSVSHNFTFFVNEGPTVVIDEAPGQESFTSVAPIEFSVTFSEAVTGFTGADVDLSASIDAGALVAAVSGAGADYTVSVTGMTGGDVTISIAKGAANAAAGGAATEASSAIDDTVTFVPNAPPFATNLVQNIDYLAGPVDIDDIFVVDPNDSVVTTAQAPQVDFPATDPDLFTLAPDPATDEGFAVQLVFTLDSFDTFGTVRVFDIGGSSNGNGIYLIDGIPYFIRKMSSTPAVVPESLNDLDMTNGNICVPLATAPLLEFETAIIALVASLDTVTWSVNGMGAPSVSITNRVVGQTNWSGDDTVRIGQAPMGGPGGLGTDPGGPFDELSAFAMVGTVSLAQMWHAPDTSGFSIQATSSPEELTATLSLTPGEGDLTEPVGATWDPVTGTWTITGDLVEVNTALADVQFIPNGVSPVAIDVTIDDGDEDGSPPLMGTITLTSLSGDADGDGIPDDYENANGLNPNDPADAASDGDSDSWSALDEYLMGTDVNDITSSPFFDIVHVSDTEVQVIYGPVLAGRTYDVSASADGQTFSLIDTFLAPADAATNTATDASGDLDVELYKLSVTVP